MKLNKIRLSILSVILLRLPQTAYAAPEAPNPGLARIPWAIDCCGKMPKYMVIGLIILIISILITIAMNIGKGNRNGK